MDRCQGSFEKLVSNSEVEQLLNTIGLKKSLQKLRTESLTIQVFDTWHVEQCEQLIVAFHNRTCHPGDKTRRMSYGISAKIINIYIKTAEVLPSKGTSQISFYTHPPIDSILLKGVNKISNNKMAVNWSSFVKEDYLYVINTLRDMIKENPFCTIEYYWKIPLKHAK